MGKQRGRTTGRHGEGADRVNVTNGKLGSQNARIWSSGTGRSNPEAPEDGDGTRRGTTVGGWAVSLRCGRSKCSGLGRRIPRQPRGGRRCRGTAIHPPKDRTGGYSP